MLAVPCLTMEKSKGEKSSWVCLSNSEGGTSELIFCSQCEAERGQLKRGVWMSHSRSHMTPLDWHAYIFSAL